MLQESNEKSFKIFPVSSHLHDLCKHYKTWSFQYNRDNACRWNVFSSSVTKRKCHKSRFRTFKFKSVLNSVSTTCNANSGTSCSPSSYLSGGIEPHSLASSNTNLASVSRLNARIGHFRVLLCLRFITSLSAKPFIWKWVLHAVSFSCKSKSFS